MKKLELLSSILKDVVIQADEILEYAKISNHELRLYLDTLQTAQSHCVQEALQHFPMDRVMKRFVEIWMETDPPYVKAMRKFPTPKNRLRLLILSIGWKKIFSKP
ncbi:MAG: hypothetical protein JRI78_00190 [Deltaproteobacteria bacterium]|nr:hypothetical protein [Deltaproteobacteria bacterium]